MSSPSRKVFLPSKEMFYHFTPSLSLKKIKQEKKHTKKLYLEKGKKNNIYLCSSNETHKIQQESPFLSNLLEAQKIGERTTSHAHARARASTSPYHQVEFLRAFTKIFYSQTIYINPLFLYNSTQISISSPRNQKKKRAETHETVKIWVPKNFFNGEA